MKLFFVICISFIGIVLNQVCSAQQVPIKIPDELSYYHYPDPLAGKRGLRIDFKKIAVKTDGSVTGTAVMYGKGLDRCTIGNLPINGTVTSNILKIGTVVPETDQMSCRNEYTIPLTTDGTPQAEGEYQAKTSNIKGRIRLD